MRPVTTNDAERLAELELLLFPENCFNETTIAREIESGGGWVAEHDGTVVGYALISADEHVVDLIRLGVHPDYQNLGMGTELLRTVLMGPRPIMLSVRVDNLKAIRLYRRHGFEIVGQLGDYGWVMLVTSSVE